MIKRWRGSSDQLGDLGLTEMFKLWAKGRVAPISDAKLRAAMMNDLHKKLSLEIDLDDFHAQGRAAQHGRARRERAADDLHAARLQQPGRRIQGRCVAAAQEPELVPQAVCEAQPAGRRHARRPHPDPSRTRVERRGPGPLLGGRGERSDVRDPGRRPGLRAHKRRRARGDPDGGRDRIPDVRRRSGDGQHRGSRLRDLGPGLSKTRPQQHRRRDLPGLFRPRNTRFR